MIIKNKIYNRVERCKNKQQFNKNKFRFSSKKGN